jgi:predicted transcriptional regulator
MDLIFLFRALFQIFTLIYITNASKKKLTFWAIAYSRDRNNSTFGKNFHMTLKSANDVLSVTRGKIRYFSITINDRTKNISIFGTHGVRQNYFVPTIM